MVRVVLAPAVALAMIAILLAGCGTTGGVLASGETAAPEAEIPAQAGLPGEGFPGGQASGADLVLAARFRQEPTVRLLLDRGVDVDARDALGRTALIAAAAEPGTGVIRLLLERGADIHLRDRDGTDALMAAVINGRVENARVLLDAGAELDARNPSGETPLMAAIRAGQVGSVDLLLSQGADPNVYSQEEVTAGARYTPLMYAARYGVGNDGLHVLRQLIRRGASAGTRRPNGETALTLAQRRGQLEMVRDLRSLGARDESPYASLGPGDTLLQAIRLDDIAKVHELLEADTDPNYRNVGTGITPLASAAWHGRLAAVEALIRRGARIDDVPWGLLEDRIAVSSVPLGQRELLRVVARGDTALISAIRRSDMPMVELLLGSRAGVMVPNREGDTPGVLAARAGEADILERLLGAGLDPNATTFPVRIDYLMTRFARGETLPPLLVEAARHGHDRAVQVLLAAGASPGLRDSQGRTALHYAADLGATAIVRSLIEAGAPMDVRDHAGESALEVARRVGHSEAVALLERGG